MPLYNLYKIQSFGIKRLSSKGVTIIHHNKKSGDVEFYSIIAAAAFIIPECNSKPNPMKALQAGAKPDVKVQAYRVQPRELAENITVSGTLIPNEETDLHPEISGKIVGLFIQEGSRAKRNALV